MCTVCCLDMVSLGVVGCDLGPVVKGWYGRNPGGGGVLYYFHTYVGSAYFLGSKF